MASDASKSHQRRERQPADPPPSFSHQAAAAAVNDAHRRNDNVYLPTYKSQVLSGQPRPIQGRLVTTMHQPSSGGGGAFLTNHSEEDEEDYYNDGGDDPGAMLFVPAQHVGGGGNVDVENQAATLVSSKSTSATSARESQTTTPSAGGSGSDHAIILKDGNSSSLVNRRKKYWIAAAASGVVIIVIIIAVVVAVVVSGNNNNKAATTADTNSVLQTTSSPIPSLPRQEDTPSATPPSSTADNEQPTPASAATTTTTAAPTLPIFSKAGNSIDGTDVNQYLGSALAMSKSGHRIAVASPGAVQVYELNNSNNEEWQQIGQDIVISDATTMLKLQGGFVAVDMDSNGENIVTGFGDENNETGIVQVHRYVSSAASWRPVGGQLTGSNAGDQFGAAVSMNADGDVIAVGAPGQDGARGMVGVYQLDSNGAWGLRGAVIQGDTNSTVSELGGSISLSANGLRVAAAGRSNPGKSSGQAQESPAVVKVFEYNRFVDFQWTALGEGVSAGTTKASTGWYVSLSAAGDRMVVSNSYLYEADFVNVETDSLRVQAFEFVNESWERLGENMHANATGPKSGYVITLSDDGLKIGMGDPGTSSGGRSRGHAHIYQFKDNDWVQMGPNIDGEADGDSFGFAVALSGDATRFAVGAPFSRAANTDAGRVQVLQL